MCFRKVVLKINITTHGLPWWLSGKESTCNVGDAGTASSIPGTRKDLLEEVMATHASVLDWRSHGQRSLAGYRVAESDTTEATERSTQRVTSHTW